jgi:tetratricopeptide (TPR) repeat protein
VLEEVVDFFSLRESQPQGMDPYQWRKVCQLLSEFIPFGKDEDFTHLHIFDQTTPEHLDYPVFATLRSAIKWLLIDEEPEQAQRMVELFSGDCWFWVGEPNFFLLQLEDIFGKFYEQEGDFQSAIECGRNATSGVKALVGERPEFYNLERTYRLGVMMRQCGRHKEALEYFREAKRHLPRKGHHAEQLKLGTAIAELYLHLGSTEKCLIHAKEAIDCSTLHPFPDPEQEFGVY